MAFNPDFKAPHRNFMVDSQSMHEHQSFLDSEIHYFSTMATIQLLRHEKAESVIISLRGTLLFHSRSCFPRRPRQIRDHFSTRDTPLPQSILLPPSSKTPVISSNVRRRPRRTDVANANDDTS